MSSTLQNKTVTMGKGPWVEIDLDQLRHNLLAAISALSPDSQLILVVKSDAYGHGIIPVVKTALSAGVTHFAVAYQEEAFAVREVSPDAEILIMGITDLEAIPLLAEKNIMPAILSLDHAQAVFDAAKDLANPLRVHLKVDTGMGRLGVGLEEADRVASLIDQTPGVELTGLFSHFATVDVERPLMAQEQVDRFKSLATFQRNDLCRHISSTRGVLFYPEWDFDGVRAGVSIYGYGTQAEGARFTTQPVLQWKTSVMQVKTVPADTPIGYYRAYQTIEEADIITVKVGYADGYPRLLSNKGYVLIGGQRLRVVGRISMNWITVLAPALSGIGLGDEVVLIGRQGEASIWADELAHTCDTIAYEIVTSIRPGLPRCYLSESKS